MYLWRVHFQWDSSGKDSSYLNVSPSGADLSLRGDHADDAAIVPAAALTQLTTAPIEDPLLP